MLTFTKAYNSYWLLYNQLSEIIPIPQHEWDRTSATSAVGNNDLTSAGAQAVFKYLDSQSKSLNTYTTNPLWRVVDGPWLISAYNASTGATTFVPNKRYSGPERPRLAKFVELPFTSEFAEVAALRTGQVDYGYLPVEDLPSAGSFKSSGDTVQAWPSWGIGYQGLNFTNPVTGPVFRQLYVRPIRSCRPMAGSATPRAYSEGGDTFTFSPDFYPTGEIIFSSGLGGDYSSATANALIADTQTASGLSPLFRYEDYIAAQLPYLWMPVTPSQVSVIAPNLHGTLPQDPDLEIYPENWYLTK